MAAIDLRPKFGPIEQQGAPNSCVAHAATSCVEAVLGISDLSRLFVYWNARDLAGQASYDAGCQPRNAVKAIVQYGAPKETIWPYTISQLLVKPDANAYADARLLRPHIKAYQSVASLASLKSALNQGLPVMFGFMVPDTFVSVTRSTGFLPMYTRASKWIGSHAAVAAGYNDATGNVLVRNTFGPTWGNQGYFEMPFAWFSSMTTAVSDAWTFIPA